MPKQNFDVLFRVSAEGLGPLLTQVGTSAILVSVSETSASVPTAPRPGTRYAGGKRDKGISATELVLKILQESSPSPVPTSSIEASFTNQGFAPNSAGPAISRLIQAGEVTKIGKHSFGLTGKTVIKLGAMKEA